MDSWESDLKRRPFRKDIQIVICNRIFVLKTNSNIQQAKIWILGCVNHWLGFFWTVGFHSTSYACSYFHSPPSPSGWPCWGRGFRRRPWRRAALSGRLCDRRPTAFEASQSTQPPSSCPEKWKAIRISIWNINSTKLKCGWISESK